jgi:hypothetical protein
MRKRARVAVTAVTLSVLLALFAEPARGQSQILGYAVGSPMLVQHIDGHDHGWNAAGGAEKIESNGAAASAELGRLYVRGGYLNWSATTISVNGSYHWRHRDRTQAWQPFLTGGLTFIIDDVVPPFNVGAGVDRWLTPHLGVRIEARDHFLVTDGGSGSLFIGARVAVVVR